MAQNKLIANLMIRLKVIHIYIMAFLIGIIAMSGYIYTDHMKLRNMLISADYKNDIAREEKNISNYEKDLEEGIHRSTYTCRHFLAVGNYNRMYNLAVKENNKKYIGIYFVIADMPSQAIPLLAEYLLKNPFDSEALAYLGYAYFKEGKYLKAIASLLKVKKKKFEILFDIAVAYERAGDITDAEAYYTKALVVANNPVYRNLIREKLAVLEISGGEKWIYRQDLQ